MSLTTINLTDPAPLTPRGVNRTHVFWLAEDSAAAPFAEAHAHIEGGTVSLTDIKFDGVPLSDATLVDRLSWDDLIAAVVAHFSGGWETLLFIAKSEEGPVMVSMPTFFLRSEDVEGAPAGFREAVSGHLNDIYLSGQIDVVEDNLDWVLDIALPPEEDDVDGEVPNS